MIDETKVNELLKRCVTERCYIIVEILLTIGADVHFDDEVLLDIAVRNLDCQMIKTLMDFGADPSALGYISIEMKRYIDKILATKATTAKKKISI